MIEVPFFVEWKESVNEFVPFLINRKKRKLIFVANIQRQSHRHLICMLFTIGNKKLATLNEIAIINQNDN